MKRLPLLALALIAGVSPSAATQGPAPARPRLYAQQLVEQALAAHPEVAGVALAARSEQGCTTIAATDPKEVGEACDEDEVGPMRSGQPHVQKEKDGFDITVPLYDAAGAIVGAVGMDFKPAPAQSGSELVERAQTIARELRPWIASKAKLFDVVPRADESR